MTQVSKYPVRKEIQERMFEVFLDSIATVKTKEQVEKLIEDLLSPTEKIMLAKRLSIALLLFKSYDQRTICKILKVSLGTVSKISLTLQKGTGGYTMVLGSLKRSEELRAFLEKLDDNLFELFSLGRKLPEARRLHWEAKLHRRKPF